MQDHITNKRLFYPDGTPMVTAEEAVTQSMQHIPCETQHIPHAVKPMEELTIGEFRDDVAIIFASMERMLIEKRKSYGPGNLLEFGLLGILIRMSDKYHRLKTFLDPAKAAQGYSTGMEENTEGLEDAFRDMIGYSTLAIEYLHRNILGDQKLWPNNQGPGEKGDQNAAQTTE